MLRPLFKFVGSKKEEPREKKSSEQKIKLSPKTGVVEEYPSRDRIYIDPKTEITGEKLSHAT